MRRDAVVYVGYLHIRCGLVAESRRSFQRDLDRALGGGELR